MSRPHPRQGETPGWPRAVHLLCVALVGALLFLPGLGRRGLSSTEGHRVIPGWEMMDSRNYWLPTLFGQVYLRKPPGMPWAVAASSSIFGQTEFAARLVSAGSTILLALLACTFAARWFGRRYGLVAGVAALLMPLFWAPGRTAEIEALNNAAAAGAVLMLLDILLFQPLRGRPRLSRQCISGLLAGAAIAAAGLAKGPAAMPAIATAVVAACIVRRSVRPLAAPGLWIAFASAGVVLVVAFLKVRGAMEASGQTPVVQGVADFLWTGRPLSLESIGAVALMPVLALFAAFPACIAMLFPWGPDARAEAAGDDVKERALLMARAATLTALISILALAMAGVRNPRYAQPCVAFLPVLAGYLIRGWDSDFYIHRRRIASVLMLGNPALLGSALAIAAVVFVQDPFGLVRDTSGAAAGRRIAASLDSPGELWANDVVEARPETLWYATKEAERAGVRVVPRWIPGLTAPPQLPSPGTYLLLRQDLASDEVAAFARAGLLDRMEMLTYGPVHKYGYVLYRISGAAE